ncbi:DASH complex subunit Dad3 [Stagonosporopsis vannaccii]|nr:DASH complex subunit Dad3 [Stagonosporopsis vannaccii]
MADTQDFGASTASHQGGFEDDESLSPLEQEVLDEYARLLGNLNDMSTLLSELSGQPSAAILDGLRGLERKTSLVFTLLKASVYSIVLNQQIQDNGQEGEG